MEAPFIYRSLDDDRERIEPSPTISTSGSLFLCSAAASSVLVDDAASQQ